MWSIGFNRPGCLPDFKPYQRETFEGARDVLTDILDEAASCARDSGEAAEAAVLEYAKARVASARLERPRQIALVIGGYHYWIALLQ